MKVAGTDRNEETIYEITEEEFLDHCNDPCNVVEHSSHVTSYIWDKKDLIVYKIKRPSGEIIYWTHGCESHGCGNEDEKNNQ